MTNDKKLLTNTRSHVNNEVMKDYQKHNLDEHQQTNPTHLDCEEILNKLTYCIDQLVIDDKHEMFESVCDALVYYELLFALVDAKNLITFFVKEEFEKNIEEWNDN